MEEHEKSSPLAMRLRKLPGQLLLALVNATALLVIVAAILVIVALNYVNNATAELAETVTDTVMAEIGIKPAELLTDIQELSAEIRDLRTALAEGRAERSDHIDQQIEAMTQALAALKATITNAGTQLADDAIRQMGNSITDGLLRLRHCQPATEPMGQRAAPPAG